MLAQAAGFADCAPPVCAIVRYEDLVRRPGFVVEELEREGLQRNDRAFWPIEESLSHGAGRAELLQRVGRGSPASAWLDEDQLARVRESMSGHCHLLSRLGYEMP
mmetsp:Transcript_36178/g.112546  ORF Transcript_36178/g.112546 Transcript_36178/m.112546 type:complete len:105 (-) Transcript_36178:84-398(-)